MKILHQEYNTFLLKVLIHVHCKNLKSFIGPSRVDDTKNDVMKVKQYVNVFTTTEKREDAEKVARILVQKRLAGCVQIIGPIQSTYSWKNRKETVEEWLCLIKSEKSLYKELEKNLKEIHPYETPEITAVPIVAGSKEYLDWLDGELKR
jgi:periplasmic divalent cation tolerance protein